MEALDASDIGQARRQARLLLDQHALAYAAHIFFDNRRVATVGDSVTGGSARPSKPFGFRLLQEALPEDLLALRHYLRQQHLETGDLIARAGEALRHLVIPIDAVLANVDNTEVGAGLMTAMIGCEAASDLPALLADTPVAWDVRVQQAGAVWCLPPGPLNQQQAKSPHLRRLLQTKARDVAVQTAQHVVCVTRHEVGARIAGWILSITARTGRSTVRVRQEDLAILLGAQRSTVNTALGLLKGIDAIGIGRGAISVRNGALLRHSACDCHRQPLVPHEAGSSDF